MWELNSGIGTDVSSRVGWAAPRLSSRRLALLLRFPFEGVM